MTNLYQQLETPAPPDLPSPGAVYDERLTAQSHRGLLVYFRKLTNILSTVLGPRGGKYLNLPYGAFQDATDQAAANTTTAYAITFDTTDYANGITLSNTSRLNVSQGGLYNVQFSVQFKNTTNDTLARIEVFELEVNHVVTGLVCQRMILIVQLLPCNQVTIRLVNQCVEKALNLQ